MNWKQEGYKVGQQACLVTEILFSEPRTKNVDVIYVGTKILKVQDGNRVIEFKGSRDSGKSRDAYLLGISYTLYKSEEEYQQYVKSKQEKQKLIHDIGSKLDGLSLDKLEEINKIIK